MSTKPTLGPFTLVPFDGRWDITRPLTANERRQYKVRADDPRGMSVLIVTKYDRAVFSDKSEADLFAAAPDLLAKMHESAGRVEMAARYIRRQIEKGAQSVETEYLSLEGIAEGLESQAAAMRAAIAKAEGSIPA